jgi:hypothetical protein
MAEKESLLNALLENAEEFGKTSYELLKLKTLDRLTDMVSYILSRMLIFVVIFMFLFMASMALGFWLGSLLGHNFYGFIIIAGVYAVIGIVLFVFAQNWLSTMIGNSLLKKHMSEKEMKITSVTGLKDAIQQLENKLILHKQVMKDIAVTAFEKMNPINMVKSMLSKVINPGFLSDILPSAMGLGAGFLSRKIGGSSSGKFKKAMMSLALYGISKFVLRNRETSKVFGHQIFNSFFSKS